MTIERLVKLLNEYEEVSSEEYQEKKRYRFYLKWGYVEAEVLASNLILEWYEVEPMIISKRYEFIAWLIENKKYENYRAYKDNIDWDYIRFINWTTIVSVNWSLYDSILCWLALSDNPTKLLLDIFK